MDSAGIIHRVLENKESLLELHSVDGAPFDFTYINYIFKTIHLQSLSVAVAAERTPHLEYRKNSTILYYFSDCSSAYIHRSQ